MRCLYCGKELALLKRWTSGGEFCSDAHRQQYQEEYNKLALTRLLQAQPAGAVVQEPQESKAVKPEPHINRPITKPEPITKPQPIAKPQPDLRPLPIAHARVEEPVAAPTTFAGIPERSKIEDPVRRKPPEPEMEEETGPSESVDFFLELPVPVMAGVAEISRTECDFEVTFEPALPSRNGEAWSTELLSAGRVALEPAGRVLDYPRNQGERGLEMREFVRSAPMTEFDLSVVGETGLMDISEEPMDILIFPHPPQGSPPLWQETEQSFSFQTELGALARLTFGTTGIEEDLEDSGTAPPPVAEPAPRAVPAQPAAAARVVEPEAVPEPMVQKAEPPPPPHKPEPPVSRPALVRPPVAATIEKPAETVRIEKPAEPVRVGKPAEPVRVEKPAEPVRVEKPAEPVRVEKPAVPVPALVTKPLPLTLHGLAAGRGKPVQVFASVTAGVDVQIPRSNALPMRPVFTLAAIAKVEEKKPAERTVVVKTDPKRVVARPDPRFANGKSRKFEPPPQDKREAEKREAEKREEKVAVAAAVKDRPSEPVIEKKPAPEVKPEMKPLEQRPAAAAVKEPVKESPRLVPVSPYSAPDLGLPNLAMESSSSFFSRLPVAAKLGAAVLLVGAVIGIAMMGGKSKNSAGSSGQVVEAGSPLPVVESGWITDWGAEAGVRKVHEISVLRPSLSLSDYRVEFQAQIETKALGWIYRAKDGKNYYVNRLEIVKPGLDPKVALVRFAVINGEEQPRYQSPLSMPLHVDTLYKIRFEAVGDHFTTYVQDQKVDEWTDSRIRMGGVGLYNERGERMSLKGGLNVVPLAIRK